MISSSTPQHASRRPLARYATARSAKTTEHHAGLARRLTDRDRWLGATRWVPMQCRALGLALRSGTVS